MISLTQTPTPGKCTLFYRGDTITFQLTLSKPVSGGAWLRTNVGNAAVIRKEIVQHVEKKMPILHMDWYDIEMTRNDEHNFSITLPLLETGYYEGKSFFLEEGNSEPLWPEGENVFIKVEPAGTSCANMMYTAFVYCKL